MLINLKSFYSPNALVYGTGRDTISGTIYISDGTITSINLEDNVTVFHTTMGFYRVVEESVELAAENTRKLINMVNYGNIFGDTSDDLR